MKKSSILTMSALAAVSSNAFAKEASLGPQQEIKSQLNLKVSSLKYDLKKDKQLLQKYQKDPVSVLNQYQMSAAEKTEYLFETQGLQLAGDNCICTGCCVTNVNT